MTGCKPAQASSKPAEKARSSGQPGKASSSPASLALKIESDPIREAELKALFDELQNEDPNSGTKGEVWAY